MICLPGAVCECTTEHGTWTSRKKQKGIAQYYVSKYSLFKAVYFETIYFEYFLSTVIVGKIQKLSLVV